MGAFIGLPLRAAEETLEVGYERLSGTAPNAGLLK
jgi:hypothetical protein